MDTASPAAERDGQRPNAPVLCTQPVPLEPMSTIDDFLMTLSNLRYLICRSKKLLIKFLLMTDPQKPQPASEGAAIGLRGGDGGGMCPGRFCFIIPCPLPCNCCIIPL